MDMRVKSMRSVQQKCIMGQWSKVSLKAGGKPFLGTLVKPKGMLTAAQQIGHATNETNKKLSWLGRNARKHALPQPAEPLSTSGPSVALDGG